MLHQQSYTRQQRRLCKLNGTHVVLRDANVYFTAVQRVGEGAPISMNARVAAGETAVDHAILV